MIDAFKEINRIFDEAAPKDVRIRCMPAGCCSYCDANQADSMMPYHHASRRCESGYRNHCTCDVCF